MPLSYSCMCDLVIRKSVYHCFTDNIFANEVPEAIPKVGESCNYTMPTTMATISPHNVTTLAMRLGFLKRRRHPGPGK